AQLRDPSIAEADAILRTCVHYGFCTNTCPTYVLTRDENESPRGRIDLIRLMLEKGGAPDVKTVAHIDSCLSCLSCMTTCAVKVDYVPLIDRARAHIERRFRRPLIDRFVRALLAHPLPPPSLFRAAIMVCRLARPMCRLSEPQQPDPGAITTSQPCRRSRRIVAALMLPLSACCAQPARKVTRFRIAPSAGNTCGARTSGAGDRLWDCGHLVSRTAGRAGLFFHRR